jgi:hypothetical protein
LVGAAEPLQHRPLSCACAGDLLLLSGAWAWRVIVRSAAAGPSRSAHERR